MNKGGGLRKEGPNARRQHGAPEARREEEGPRRNISAGTGPKGNKLSRTRTGLGQKRTFRGAARHRNRPGAGNATGRNGPGGEHFPEGRIVLNRVSGLRVLAMLTSRRPEVVVSGLVLKCFIGGAGRSEIGGRAGGAEARRGAAPAAPLACRGALRRTRWPETFPRDVIGVGRTSRGYSCEVTASRARALDLERRGQRPEEPPRGSRPGPW